MNGQKLSLHIGVNNYPGAGMDLSGCVNDAKGWQEVLKARGFGTQILLDADATRLAIREFIQAIITATRYGDIAVITFSGHGTWVPDVSGDEPDRRDEALCPWDVVQEGPLDDDEIQDLFAERHHGSRIIMISDSCHSGSVARFAPATLSTRPKVRFMPPSAHLLEEEVPAARAVAAVLPSGRPRTGALLMAACRDSEYAYDGYGPRQQGAFTAAALDSLGWLKEGATYRDWMVEIRKLLPAADIPQTPQLCGTPSQYDWPVFEPSENA